jgi:hypothetical protein
MEIMRQIEAELYSLDGILPGGSEFITRFAPYRIDRTTTYIFSDEHLFRDALSLLSQYGLKATTYYIFRLNQDEIKAYPALYIGIHNIDGLLIDDQVNERKLGKADMAKDYQSERIVITLRVKNLLERMSKGMKWEPVEGMTGREFILMNVEEYLPEPVIVPSPVYIGPNENPPGTYAVQSDGRDVITNANIAKLKNVGIAVSGDVRVKEEVMKWRPRLIASGEIVQALQSAKVKGLLEPISPLLTESHPLSSLDDSTTKDI